MHRDKLQVLIAAGVFSTALLAGAAYADDKTDDSNQVQVSTPTAPDTSGQDSQATAPTPKQKTSSKSGKDMGCSSANGCGNH